MGCSAFVLAVTPFLGVPTRARTRTRTSPATQTPLRRRSQRQTPHCAAEPPKVKATFYKNPSRAIEKGGGFYVPGLRGPRLRVFVATAAGTLLTLNHAASLRAAPPQSLAASEVAAILAVFAVALSAFLDIRRDQALEAKAQTEPVADPALAKVSQSSAVTTAPTTPSSKSKSDAFEWVARTATQLTPTSVVAVFENDTIVYRSDNGNLDVVSGGEVVKRVSAENKAVYVNDTRKLPPGVDLPFLPESVSDAWCTYVLPIRGGTRVVVFAAPLNGTQSALKSGDRAWLRECSMRLEMD